MTKIVKTSNTKQNKRRLVRPTVVNPQKTYQFRKVPFIN